MSHRSLVMVKRTYLNIAVVTLVTATIWLIITIYHAIVAPSVVNVDQVVLTPINPKIDEEVLQSIVAREDVSLLPFEPVVVTTEPVTINEVATPTQTIVASESAVIEEEL